MWLLLFDNVAMNAKEIVIKNISAEEKDQKRSILFLSLLSSLLTAIIRYYLHTISAHGDSKTHSLARCITQGTYSLIRIITE